MTVLLSNWVIFHNFELNLTLRIIATGASAEHLSSLNFHEKVMQEFEANVLLLLVNIKYFSDCSH